MELNINTSNNNFYYNEKYDSKLNNNLLVQHIKATELIKNKKKIIERILRYGGNVPIQIIFLYNGEKKIILFNVKESVNNNELNKISKLMSVIYDLEYKNFYLYDINTKLNKSYQIINQNKILFIYSSNLSIKYLENTNILNYKGIIDVKGDGNCYFRAIFGSLLISILYFENNYEQQMLYIDFLNTISNNKLQSFFNKLFIDNKSISYIDFVILLSIYDVEIIKFLRDFLILKIKEIYQSKKTFYLNKNNSLSLLDYISSQLNKHITLDQYLNENFGYKEQNATYMEGAFVISGLLSFFLYFFSNVVTLFEKKYINNYLNSNNKINMLPGTNIFYDSNKQHYLILIPGSKNKTICNILYNIK